MYTCSECSRDSEYSCSCSEKLFCKQHIWKHLSESPTHKISKLYLDSSPECFEMIAEKLNFLKQTQKEILNKTFEIQQHVKTLCDQTIKSLGSIITRLKIFLSKKKITDIGKQFVKSIVTTKTNRLEENSMAGIEKFYNRDYFKHSALDSESKIKRSFLTKVVGSIFCINITNDQNFIVCGGIDSVVRVINLKDFKCTSCLFKHRSKICSLATNSHSDLVVSGSEDNQIILWKFKENKIIKVLKMHDMSVILIKIDSSNSKAFSADYIGIIHVWSLSTYNVIYSFVGVNINRIISPIVWFIFNSSKFLQVSENKLSIYNENSKVENTYTSSSKISCFHLANNESFALLGLIDGSLVLLDLPSYKEITIIKKCAVECNFVNSSKDDKYFLSSHSNKLLFIYSIESCEAIRSFEIYDACKDAEIMNDLSLAFYLDTHFINKIHINSFTLSKIFSNYFYYKYVEVSSDHSFVVYPSQNCAFSVWDISKQMVVKKLSLPHHVTADCLSLSNCGKYLLTGSSDYLVRWWDLQSSKCLTEFRGHTGVVHDICLNSHLKIGVSCSNNEIIMWDIEQKKSIRYFRDNFKHNRCLTISNCGRFIAFIRTGKITVIDINQSNPAILIPGKLGVLTEKLRFSRSGNVLICITIKGRVICLNIRRRIVLKEFISLKEFKKFSINIEEYRDVYKELIFI